jgi:hypothetical protein
MSINTYTFQSNNYSIITSLNERTIYLKITDTVSFYQYEGNVDIKELRLNIELKDAFTIICNCFKEDLDEDYDVTITVNSNMLKLQFNALVGGFLKMNFEVLLREKVMSNDGQLTINFNRLEQKLNAGLQKLELRCQELEEIIEKKNEAILDLTNKLSYSHLNFCHSGHPNTNHFIHLNVKKITDFTFANSASHFRPDLVEYLYQLEELHISHFRYASFNAAKMKSKSLKLLYIQNHNETQFNSLEGISQIPNLESLTISNAPCLSSIPTILKSYKHKINYIKIYDCKAVNVVELQTYCQTNNIKLEIS